MKRFLMILLVTMVGFVLACGSEEEKAPAKTAAPPEKVEEAVPHPPLVAPEPPKAGQPEAEHPKAELTKPKKTNLKKKSKRKPKKAKPKKVQQSP
jgi:outer membrane biosynthesis protein TonB